MPSEDWKQEVPVKKVALRELSSEMTNIMPKANGVLLDFFKVLGTKRLHPDYPASPISQSHSWNTSANGNRVYVRRKLDREAAVKIGSCDDAGTFGSPESKKIGSQMVEESKGHHEHIQESKSSPPKTTMPVVSPKPISVEPLLSPSLGKPIIGLSVPEPNAVRETDDFVVKSMGPPGDERHNPSRQHRKERFDPLEEYTRNLRNLSAVDLSRHAVDLEKWAIQLMLEESQEMHRTMVLLNVLGQNLPQDGSQLPI